MPQESSHYEFVVFYQSWIHDLLLILNDLLLLDEQSNGKQLVSMDTLLGQIQRLLLHYVKYYEEKFRLASARDQNPTLAAAIMFFSPPWLTALEISFLWIGGFRPTRIFPILRASVTDISGNQAESVEALKKRCEMEEKAIENDLDRVKDILGTEPLLFTEVDSSVVDLDQIIGLDGDEVDMSNGHCGDANDDYDMDDYDGDDEVNEKIVEVLEAFRGSMLSVLMRADGLRRGTVSTIVEILTPPQTVKFLVAVAKYHLALRNWGINTHI